MNNPVEPLVELWESHGERPALVWNNQEYSYAELAASTRRWAADERLQQGAVIGLAAEYSPQSISALFGALWRGAIVAPVTSAFERERESFFDIAQANLRLDVDAHDGVSFRPLQSAQDAPLLVDLAATGQGGLVLFSSGATGRSKAVVHGGGPLLERYRTPRRPTKSIAFMLFDHIGGIHATLHTLSSGGTLVLISDHQAATVCRAIQDHKVEVLPCTPTFLNLLLLVDLDAYDLSSLKYLSYSAERMPQAALLRLKSAFPNVRLAQSYGLSEAGIMNARSESSDSLWVKLGGDGFSTRVRDGLLEIKSDAAMLGYLNAESPFTEDGWLRTGDRVEQRGDYIRILGRASDLIITGGEKVYPAEVEDAILALDGVVDVVVRGEDNAISGKLVMAEVHLCTDETRSQFRRRMTDSLRSSLASHKIPQRVKISKTPLHGARMKKNRKAQLP